MRHARTILAGALLGCLAALGCQGGQREFGGQAPEEPKEEGRAPGPIGELEAVSPGSKVSEAKELPLDATRRIGEPVQARNLTVWAVFADSYPEIGEFLTLAEARERNLATVRELGSGDSDAPEAGASVNAVVIENQADVPVFACAGTVIQGGKQDRQIGEDLVIAPREKAQVPVFCVEAARWTPRREGKDTAGAFEVLDVVAAQEVRVHAQYGQDQTSVWSAVDRYNALSGQAPATRTFVASVEAPDAEAAAERVAMEAIVLRHFERLRESGRAPIGFAYSIDGEPVTVRTFAHPRLLEKYLPAFARTMSLEAELAQRVARKSGREVYGQLASLEKVVEFVRQVGSGEAELRRTTSRTLNRIRRNARGGSAQCEMLVPAASVRRNASSSPSASRDTRS